ncbi:MAG: FAD-dependent thymidylate synthase [Acidobacteriales bacterium]|nr:FAD-dependent thymidylate synthase [Terriglobales bacterium]
MNPERCAYALARYSRSPDSIEKSIEWVRAHDSRKFLESFYFQYGHASIADLGHVVACFEGISELAATEVEDEQLWDGQAKSSRYQDFSRCGSVVPPELDAEQAVAYRTAGQNLLDAYRKVHAGVNVFLADRHPRPDGMKPDAYERNIAARAFDVARYLLFLGVPTNVGQVTSIRTLERQMKRLLASEYAELRELAAELAEALRSEPDYGCQESTPREPVAPTLAEHVEPDRYALDSREALRQWAAANLPARAPADGKRVDLLKPSDTAADIVATLLYPVTDRPYRQLYEFALSIGPDRRREVLDLGLRSRTVRDELTRGFRGGIYVYDIVMDIGAYRDLHRHRRSQQFRQAYSARLGFETPKTIVEAGLDGVYQSAIRQAIDVLHTLPEPGAHYLIPFGARSRFLFKMDFAEAEYITRLRSWVKGHFSYREIAWEMKCRMEELEPELGRLIEATPPWVEDPLRR